jgi:hypothetical protein
VPSKLHPTQARVLEIAKRIAIVEAQLDPLQRELAELRAEFSRLVPGEPAAGNQDDAESAPGGAPLPDQILAVMRAEPMRQFTADDFAQRLGAKLPTLRSTLQRLLSEGKIHRPFRGQYCLEPPPLGMFEEMFKKTNAGTR